MGVDAKVDAVMNGVDGSLELAVVEGFDRATGVADEVVVVLPVGVGGLVAGDAIAGVDAGDQREPVQKLEGAVDAGDADRSAVGRDPRVDLLSAGAAGLAGERCEHGVAGGAGASPAA